MTPGQTLIELWVISSIQLVNGELPDRVRTGWAVQGIAVTLVGHSKYQISVETRLCLKNAKSNNYECRFMPVLQQ